jgi:hypothetical protein
LHYNGNFLKLWQANDGSGAIEKGETPIWAVSLLIRQPICRLSDNFLEHLGGVIPLTNMAEQETIGSNYWSIFTLWSYRPICA